MNTLLFKTLTLQLVNRLANGLGLLFLGSIITVRTKLLVRKDILNTLNVLILLSLKSQVGNLIEIPRE